MVKVERYMIPRDKLCQFQSETTLLDIAKTMAERKCGSAVVTQKTEKAGGEIEEAIGIITNNDLVRAIAHEMNPSETKANQIMSTELKYCQPEEPFSDVSQMMTEQHLHHILVRPDGGELCGLVSAADLVKQSCLDAKAWPWNRGYLDSLWHSGGTESSAPEGLGDALNDI